MSRWDERVLITYGASIVVILLGVVTANSPAIAFGATLGVGTAILRVAIMGRV